MSLTKVQADIKREEALLNEYKGNLFEFLVAIALSRSTANELQFLSNLDPSFQTMLGQQEQMLRKFAPNVLSALSTFSTQVAEDILIDLKVDSSKRLEIILVGKSLSGTKNSEFAEADILLKSCTNTIYPLSLKISKSGVFVNTKSAGIKTFFSRYISGTVANEIQSGFNLFVSKEYEKFAIQMHLEAGIEYTKGFQSWEYAGLELLPGQLSEEYRVHLIRYYSVINERVFNELSLLLKKEPLLFNSSLMSLIGFSSKDIVQVTCFYSKKNDEMKFKANTIHKWEEIYNSSSKVELVKNKTNIEIHLDRFILQLRAKPMNKFTSEAFKINCSVKFLVS